MEFPIDHFGRRMNFTILKDDIIEGNQYYTVKLENAYQGLLYQNNSGVWETTFNLEKALTEILGKMITEEFNSKNTLSTSDTSQRIK